MFKQSASIILLAFSLLAQAEPVNETVTSTAPSSLKKDDLLNILAAEFAIQRDQYDQALGFYLNQAKNQRDPYLAERATQLAMHQKKYVDMLEAALIWQKTAPANETAHFFVSLAYGLNMQANIALENMRKVLQMQGETDFTRLVNLMPKGSVSEDFYIHELVQASKLYPKSYDVTLALALLYQRQDQQVLALEYTDKTRQLAGSNAVAIEYIIRLYSRYDQPQKALDTYRSAISKDPDNILLRQNFAQYALQYDLAAAKEQLEFLHQQQPSDDFTLLNLGLIELEQGNLEAAENYFLELRQSGQRVSAANYYLGEIYKYQGDLDKALAAFTAVTDRNETDRATIKIIAIYIEQQRYTEAGALIQTAMGKSGNQQYTEQLLVMKAANLEKQGNAKEAYQLLTQLLDKNPDSFELRYSRAMLAETKNELNQMESDLRHIISLYPDSALALNALGYTLADKTTRYQEALALIEQAQNLVPDDPAILDSLGWVLFRLGRTSEAIAHLQRALALMPDAEVAAHLGEVLWVSGQQENARQVFRDALQATPGDPVLNETIKRLNIGL